jgi:hypothetical protein
LGVVDPILDDRSQLRSQLGEPPPVDEVGATLKIERKMLFTSGDEHDALPERMGVSYLVGHVRVWLGHLGHDDVRLRDLVVDPVEHSALVYLLVHALTVGAYFRARRLHRELVKIRQILGERHENEHEAFGNRPALGIGPEQVQKRVTRHCHPPSVRRLVAHKWVHSRNTPQARSVSDLPRSLLGNRERNTARPNAESSTSGRAKRAQPPHTRGATRFPPFLTVARSVVALRHPHRLARGAAP